MRIRQDDNLEALTLLEVVERLQVAIIKRELANCHLLLCFSKVCPLNQCSK